ncbi:hypothetical protein MOMUL_23880 [Moorella mulderi DSM 14980]|uniref:Uncharacterized protein n=1 Tax=Moorella mulderi DSM 14980 TaxID=1122241 RepID=A0A151AV92_9FIRM|nr:hypothetical protein MOMUL_23880 [Moorella mulderi DSM 14980]
MPQAGPLPDRPGRRYNPRPAGRPGGLNSRQQVRLKALLLPTAVYNKAAATLARKGVNVAAAPYFPFSLYSLKYRQAVP